MKTIIALLSGLIFGFGLVISGMSNPAKVLNFLDVAAIANRTWDASLAFVMGGALIVAGIGYKLAFRRARPIFDDVFYLPTNLHLDARLIGGAALFGIGWGLGGFCPGPALTAIHLMTEGPIVFAALMFAGMIVAKLLLRTQMATKSGN